MSVSSFFVINGQEIVAEVVSEHDDCFIIKRPLAVHMMHGPNGQPQIGFAPLSMIRTDTDVTIYKHSIISPPHAVEAEVEASYIQNTTGIAIAAPGQILHG